MLNTKEVNSRRRLWLEAGYGPLVIISAQARIGMDSLRSAAALLAGENAKSIENHGVVVFSRHRQALRRARRALARARRIAEQSCDLKSSAERLAADLREASVAIGEVFGQVGGDDVLRRIFEGFCIGK